MFSNVSFIRIQCVDFNLFIKVDMDVNHMTIQMPHQLFINGEFVDSSNGRTFDTINPTDGSVSI